MDIFSLVVSIVSALIAAGSLWFTYKQWKKVRAKIVMIEDSSKASEILPTWYAARMMTDNWLFGLLTSDGNTVVITKINGVSDDGQWLDVELATKDEFSLEDNDYIFAVADDRRSASIQVNHIVTAIELISS